MKYTKREASDLIADMLTAFPLMTPHHQREIDSVRNGVLYEAILDSASFSFELEGIRGAEVTLRMDGKEGVTLCWSSTDRTIALANATIGLYQQVLGLASKIQAFMDCATITDLPVQS